MTTRNKSLAAQTGSTYISKSMIDNHGNSNGKPEFFDHGELSSVTP